jgi:hypothetical protein
MALHNLSGYTWNSKKYFHKEDANLHDIAHHIAHVHVNIKASEINSKKYQSFPS